MDISEYRRENLRRFTNANGGPAAVAKRLGYSNASYLVQMIGPNPLRSVTERTARKVEEVFNLPERTLDAAPPVLVEPPKAAVTAPEPQRVQDAALSPLQLGQLVQMVGRICEAEGASLSTPKFADVVALAVTNAAEHGGQADESLVKTLVRLAR